MKRLLYIWLVLAVLTGCQQRLDTTTHGELRLQSLGIEVDGTVTPMGKGTTDATTATGGLQTVIYDQNDQIITRFAANKPLPPTVPLRAGSYRIEAQTQDGFPQSEARFDTPLYYGSKNFEIQAGQVTSIALTCKERTASAKITYSDDFKAIFPTDRYRYKVVMSSSLGARITIESTQTQAAFFQVATGDVELFYTVFLQKKEPNGTWVDLWGDSDGLRLVSFRVAPKNGKTTIEPAVRYDIVVAVR